ncbi:MAG TPA: DUF1254 domain-containing protein [Anaerolineae bacterium]|nr:DUF1254 domain-containing protein [Anaerolineae bacterium]
MKRNNVLPEAFEITNGYPALEAVSKIYDELDYQRAVQSYLWAMPAVACYSFIQGLKRDYQADMYTVNIWQKSATPVTRVLTGNSQSIYAVGYFDLAETGPMVLEFPPNVLGMIDDLWYAPVSDVGIAGPDKGKGGKYLILPPGYQGETPDGYFTFTSTTNLNIWLVRGFKGQDGSSPVASLKKMQFYPLDRAEDRPQMTYKLVSDIPADLTFPTDERFFEAMGAIFSQEAVRDRDMAYLGMLQSLGIEHGKPFAPDDRLQAIFKKAAATGEAMARTLSFSSRNPNKNPYPDRQWEWIFLTDRPDFYAANYLDIEARVSYTFQACFTANAMVVQLVGAGSQYLAAFKDSRGEWLDGAKLYKLTLPPDVPVENFWSLMVYSSETRSMVVTDTHKAGVDSYGRVRANEDGSINLYVGPEPPPGMESNWVKTNADEGFFVYLRFFGPKQAFFDKTWVPGDLEPVSALQADL